MSEQTVQSFGLFFYELRHKKSRYSKRISSLTAFFYLCVRLAKSTNLNLSGRCRDSVY